MQIQEVNFEKLRASAEIATSLLKVMANSDR
ncbi:MAG TPA: transcriptional regulator, partial [Methylotenera mobilis]|nr:transcriptional regulator [Methylotenera mobilis]